MRIDPSPPGGGSFRLTREPRMAKWSVAASLALALVALAGCQQQGVVSSLPPPNFNGPTLADPPVAAQPLPQPPPVAVAPPKPLPVSPTPSAGVPREWVPMARANQWNWIIIHHSATPTGGAQAFDKMHKAKGWDELGYHFVVGNGTDTRDGQVEVGPRWPKQKWGAHTKTLDNQFNNFGIGVCLVGNFDVTRPSAAQMQATSRLVAYLMKTYHVPPERVIGHGMAKPTECPGRYMSVAEVRRLSGQILTAGEDTTPGPAVAPTATASLLHDVAPR
jgi:hypothetical protein